MDSECAEEQVVLTSRNQLHWFTHWEGKLAGMVQQKDMLSWIPKVPWYPILNHWIWKLHKIKGTVDRRVQETGSRHQLVFWWHASRILRIFKTRLRSWLRRRLYSQITFLPRSDWWRMAWPWLATCLYLVICLSIKSVSSKYKVKLLQSAAYSTTSASDNED